MQPSSCHSLPSFSTSLPAGFALLCSVPEWLRQPHIGTCEMCIFQLPTLFRSAAGFGAHWSVRPLPSLETHFMFLLINYGPLLSTLVFSQNMASLCAAIALFLFICDPNLSSCSTSYAWMSSPLESLCQNGDICFINPLCQDSNPLAAVIIGNSQC